MLTKEEVNIAIDQFYYERPDLTGRSEENRRSRTVGNFWSEGEEELRFRPAQKIPHARYCEISGEFRGLVAELLSECNVENRITSKGRQHYQDFDKNYPLISQYIPSIKAEAAKVAEEIQEYLSKS